MVRTLKMLICIEMFVLGLFVGYGIFVLHWLIDYTAPTIQAPYSTQITNVTSEGGFICYTISQQQQNDITTTVRCKKK